MAVIGTFKEAKDGGFEGNIRTATINLPVRIVKNTQQSNGNAPAYRVFSGEFEMGAGWMKTSDRTNRQYVSIRLDDPSFVAPIDTSLVESEEGYRLLWSRRNASLNGGGSSN